MSERKKGCELCSRAARMLCDSDDASLCWECDEKVHSANFLVAKHSRTLLCHLCQSPTPWKAAGPKLAPTLSVCHACSASETTHQSHLHLHHGEYYYTESSDDENFSEEEDNDDDEEEEEDGENQVVPWSTSASNSSSGGENVSLSSSKRARDDPFESDEDEDGCCSSPPGDENYSSSSSLLRPLKMRRSSSDNNAALIPSEQAADRQPPRQFDPLSGTTAIVEKLRRFEREIAAEEGNASAMILGLCKLTGD